MTITKKKLMMGTLSMTILIATPIATTVSCGKKTESKKTEGLSESKVDNKQPTTTTNKSEETTKEQIKKPVVAAAENEIDLSKMNSPKELIVELNKKLNFIMPKKATDLAQLNGSSLSKEGFDNIVKYMGSIKTKYKTIVFKNGDKKFEWDLKDLYKTIEDAKNALKLGYAAKAKPSFMTLLTADNPTMAIYPLKQLGGAFGIGLKLQGFTDLPKGGYAAYQNMLGVYHDLSLAFIKSDIYKEWIKGKTFELPEGTVEKTKTVIVQPGTVYDDHTSAKVTTSEITKSSKFKTEANNFEAQLVLTIMNLY